MNTKKRGFIVGHNKICYIVKTYICECKKCNFNYKIDVKYQANIDEKGVIYFSVSFLDKNLDYRNFYYCHYCGGDEFYILGNVFEIVSEDFLKDIVSSKFFNAYEFESYDYERFKREYKDYICEYKY